MGDYIRAFSESQFSKDHKTPEVRISSSAIPISRRPPAFAACTAMQYVKSDTQSHGNIVYSANSIQGSVLECAYIVVNLELRTKQ